MQCSKEGRKEEEQPFVVVANLGVVYQRSGPSPLSLITRSLFALLQKGGGGTVYVIIILILCMSTTSRDKQSEAKRTKRANITSSPSLK